MANKFAIIYCQTKPNEMVNILGKTSSFSKICRKWCLNLFTEKMLRI